MDKTATSKQELKARKRAEALRANLRKRPKKQKPESGSDKNEK